MPRGLILRNDHLEAIDRACVVAPLHVVAADQHHLPSQLIARLLNFALGRYRILGTWILSNHLVEHGDGLLGPFLVTRDVADLIEVARADQELRIGSVRTAGMKLDIAPGR